eukprot:412175_1
MAMEVDKFLECPICRDVADNAVETECCNKIFCQKCISNLQSTNNMSCPLCRKSPIKTNKSILARRMIDSLPCQCPNKCDEKLTRCRLQNHLKLCPNRRFKCSFKDCDFKGISSEYLKHINQRHKDNII